MNQNLSRSQMSQKIFTFNFTWRGNFGKLANNLLEKKWKFTIEKLIKDGHMLFGICVGMQLLFDSSEEAPGTSGLGILNGSLSNFKQIILNYLFHI